MVKNLSRCKVKKNIEKFTFYYVSFTFLFVSCPYNKEKAAADIHIRATANISFTITNFFSKTTN